MRIHRKLAAAAIALVLAVPLATVAHAERRVALVIGNDEYQHLEKLQRAVADALSYAEVLNAKGFDQVILKNNLTRGQLDEAIASFLDQIEPGDIAVFAYSGHGWSDGIQNYIVGTDAPAMVAQNLLARISIPLKNGINGVLDEMDQKGARLKVAIIDACRDNPFTPLPGKRSIWLNRGMTRIDPPNGTFVAFSAGAGQSALDRLSDSDPDPNSVFTRVFLRAIRADMTLQDAIKRTQEQVVALAKSIQEDQKPAYYDEVIGSACLSDKCASGADEGAWQRIANSADPVDLESFARMFPDSAHKAEADAKAKSLRVLAEPKMARLAALPKARPVDEWQAGTPVAEDSVVAQTPDARWAPWGVQVAGNFSLDRAMARFTAIQQAFPALVAGPPMIVPQVNRKRGQAPLYQILIPATDRNAANDICRQLQAADSPCVVFRN